ncbi:sodium:proton antiporter NhaD [Ferruginibacter sp. HRS2-29]|uniref:sodium:proton antiporter NhaD n=1 Tax=Ferruginibacter sp. HRS2-29 TaxID=2487334 RepID=UPI0020CDD5C1|nr:sodium:proton antiporter NhaD [Ferruginibacter sp. HRS2-29]MCP9753511.1 sodium:proton antiporter [Ferruginibacter sp. HRS2-29]
MIAFIITAIFILGYVCIAFEHPLRINKAASALITGVLCWTVYILQGDAETVTGELLHHLGETASILFFLLGAMTIVELIDSHNGFDIITRKISTKSKSKLLLLVALITFFLSALLDNLTTAIVMTSLCSKILSDKEDKLWFAGMIVIAANAGGAWSPLGDVTTTMLWIGGQISALNIIKQLLLPSIAVCILPALIISRRFRGKTIAGIPAPESSPKEKRDGKVILIFGIGFLVFVPVFKTLTHLPPFMGMLLALGLMWIITTVIHKTKEPEIAERYTVSKALQKVDTPSILFFLGILLAVAALQSFGLLKELATFLTATLKNDYLIGASLGLLSALVDNVPLVAASQGMYDLTTYPMDHPFWEFLALTTGTGGSAIIIGSAAGVAVMGIEQIDFMWYLKKISWLAILGFVAGIAVFLLQHAITS